MSRVFDLDDMTAEDLEHLAWLKRHQEQERLERLYKIIDRPALGACRRWVDAT